ncbi:MAG: TolC family protein, partial [Spirochaetales bacterium]|nr:TolC family protein [Spirochaetales bacterium]
SLSRMTLSTGLSIGFTGGMAAAIRTLNLQYESALLSHEEVRRSLLYAVETEFYYLLKERSNLDIQKRNIELADNLYAQAKVRFDNGLAPELDVLQARVNAANLVPVYESKKAAYQARLKEFLLVLGIDPMSEVSLEGTIDARTLDLDADRLIATYLDKRADIRAQSAAVAIRESGLARQRLVARLPSLNLSASVSDTLDTGTFQSIQDEPELSLSLGLSFNLTGYLPVSSTSLAILEQKDEITRAKHHLETLSHQAALEIINLVNILRTDAESLSISTLNLELSETSYEMARLAFSTGKTSRMNLDDAQQDLLVAQQNLLESKYQYRKNFIALKNALGLDIGEELSYQE